MSHALRYGLALLVLIAGTAGAFYFRDAGEIAIPSWIESRSLPMAQAETIQRNSVDPGNSDDPALPDPPPERETIDRPDPFAPEQADSPSSSAVTPVAGFLENNPDPPAAEFVSQGTSAEKVPCAPEFELGFAAIDADDGWTTIPTRGAEAPPQTEQQAAQPERTFIPARKTNYLPRAFRRKADGPAADLPQPHRRRS